MITKYTRAVAEHNGEVYYASTSEAQTNHLWIIKIRGESYATDEGFEHKGDVTLKQVPIAELDGWYRDQVKATWRGEPFVVHPLQDGKVGADFVGGSSVWAEENGLEGDQYSGFHGVLDEGELENVQVDRTDYLARWKKENQG